MKLWQYLSIFSFCCLMLLLLPGAANAASTGGGTCSEATATTTPNTGQRIWSVVLDSENRVVVNGCGGWSPTPSLVDVNSGSSITLQCFEDTLGISPPGPADTNGITIKFFGDNDGFGNTGATANFSKTFSSCNPKQTFTVFCTSDGTNLGNPVYGIERIQIHAVRTTVVTYDINSEDANGQVGIYRCNPRPTLMIPANTPSANNPWIGGDTYDARITVDSTVTSSAPGNTGNLRVNCNDKETTPSPKVFGTVVQTVNTLLEGSASVWETGCTLIHNATLTQFSAISFYSGTDYAIWDQLTPISGVSFPNNKTVTFTSAILNRIITPNGVCNVLVDGSTFTIANRGSTVTVNSCGPWKDARSNSIPNNKFSRGWQQKSNDYRVTSDFNSFDGQFSSTANFQTTNLATNVATVTNGLNYHKMVETFETSARTDAVLQNWGNSTGILDVSASLTFDNINISKSTPPTSANNATCLPCAFTIGTDVEHTQTKGLREASNNFIANANVTCTRNQPDGSLDNTFTPAATDISGNSGIFSMQVFAPPGKWSLNCAVSFNGNSGNFNIVFFHNSAFTGDKQIVIDYKIMGNNIFISCGLHSINATSQNAIETDTIDNPNDFRYSVFYINNFEQYQTGPTGFCTPSFVGSHAYFANFTIPQPQPKILHVHAFANFTGSPLLGTTVIQFTNQSFSGNFTGNVTDMSAIPVSIAYPALMVGMFVVSLVIAFAIKNPLPAFGGVILNLIGIILLNQNNSTLTSDETTVFYLVFGAGMILCLFRTYFSLNQSGTVR